MIWVTWRQHRTQAIICLAVFGVLTILAVALGTWMRADFSSDGLGGCLARSGGTGCTAAIRSFLNMFNNGVSAALNVPLLAIPGLLGAAVGATLLGRELELGTWRLAWSQTVPRTRWLATKLVLVTGGLVVFGVAVTAVMAWYSEPLDRLTSRLLPPLGFGGPSFTCSLLCAFGLGALAGLLLRNTIGAMVAAYVAWEIPTGALTLLSGPIHLWTSTMRISCQAGCPDASTNSVVPVTGHLGDQVLSVTRSGSDLVVTYLPADRYLPTQFLTGGVFLVIAAATLSTAVWLLHRRTT
jgi:hypothetical protein